MKRERVYIALIVVLSAAVLLLAVYAFGLRAERKARISLYRPERPRPAKGLAAPSFNFRIGTPSSFGATAPQPAAWDPFLEMERIQRQMNRMFKESFDEAFFENAVPANAKGFFEPETDVKETQDAYIIQMDIPGMSKDEIVVSAKGGILTVSGERKREASEQGKGGAFKREREFGYFSRSMTLPQDVKREGITAAYDKGVLSVVLPKAAATKEQGEQTVKVKVD